MEAFHCLSIVLWLVINLRVARSSGASSWKALERDELKMVSYAYYVTHEKHALSLPLMKTLTTLKKASLDCGFACTGLSWCMSYNFQRNSSHDGLHQCELLSSDKYNNSNAFQPNEEFDHFSIRVSKQFRNDSIILDFNGRRPTDLKSRSGVVCFIEKRRIKFWTCRCYHHTHFDLGGV